MYSKKGAFIERLFYSPESKSRLAICCVSSSTIMYLQYKVITNFTARVYKL